MKKQIFTWGMVLFLAITSFTCSGLSTEDIASGGFLSSPEISSVTSMSSTSLQVTFAQNMQDSVSQIENYSITANAGSLSVTKATIVAGSNNKIITIDTSAQESSLLYSLTVKNVKTSLGKEVASEGVQFNFTGYNLDILNIVVLQDENTHLMGSFYHFGTQFNGTDSNSVTFTIKNIGQKTLVLTGDPIVELSSGDTSLFSITQPVQTMLAPNETTTFTAQFKLYAYYRIN